LTFTFLLKANTKIYDLMRRVKKPKNGLIAITRLHA